MTPKDQPGTHDYQISPDGRWAVHRYSTLRHARPRSNLIRLPSHERVGLLSDNAALKKKLAGLKKAKTEFFRVDIGDGIALDGWCMLPPDFDPKAKYPLLVHVYGEPAGQTVLDAWGGGNALMASDARPAGLRRDELRQPRHARPRGRAWRKAVIARSASSPRRSRPPP